MSESKKTASALQPLGSLVNVDPESLPLGTAPGYRFRYIDIASATNGKLLLPDDTIEYRDAPSRARRVVRNGDVLMSTVRPNLKAFAYCRLPPEDFVASTGFAVLRAKEGTDPQFVLYSILSDDVTKQIERYVVGSNYPAINSSDVKRLLIRQLSSAHQKHIAEILSTVDEAIEQTEALIAKTQQIKVGLMHDLFTRGITPDGQLRPPREEAPHLYKESPLGWIPKEWEALQLGTMSEIVSGVTLNGTSSRGGIEVPYLRVANVQDGYLDLKDVKTIWVDASQLSKLALRRGDVLMNEGGDFDKLGRGTVWNEEIVLCIHQNHVFRVRPRIELLRSQFLAYWSQSEFGKKYFVLSSKQSTNLASINSTQLHQFLIGRPSSLEQETIEMRLISADSQLDALQDELEKLRRLRTGLMHDLLTGRVRMKVSEPASA